MVSEQKTVKKTAEQQKKHDTHIFMQREALVPQRIEKNQYDGLQRQVADQGSLTSKEVKKVRVWRSLAAAPGETAKMTAEQQKKHDTLTFMQREALVPQRIERVSTTDYRDKSPYVPGATLRLRDVDKLTEQGALKAEEAERVKGWRSLGAASDEAAKKG